MSEMSTANKNAGGKGGNPSLLHSGRFWSALPDHER